MIAVSSRIRSFVDEDGATILDADNDKILSLNPTAGFIWSRLLAGVSPDVITQQLADETSEPLDNVRVHFDQFIEAMKVRRFISLDARGNS